MRRPNGALTYILLGAAVTVLLLASVVVVHADGGACNCCAECPIPAWCGQEPPKDCASLLELCEECGEECCDPCGERHCKAGCLEDMQFLNVTCKGNTCEGKCPKCPKCPTSTVVIHPPQPRPLWNMIYGGGPRIDGDGYQLMVGAHKERASGRRYGFAVTYAHSSGHDAGGWMLDPWWRVTEHCDTVTNCSADNDRWHAMATISHPVGKAK